MQNITNSSELRNAIEILEIDQFAKKQILREEFRLLFENLRPENLIKNAVSEIINSPYQIDNLIGTTLGIAGGYLSKKMIMGASGGLGRRLLGSILQFGVTTMVSQNPETLKNAAQYIYNFLFNKKEKQQNPGECK